MYEDIPEEIVEYIISFKFNNFGHINWEYNLWKSKTTHIMEMVNFEFNHWYSKGLTIPFLKATTYQKGRAGIFLRSLKEGSGKPAFTCHVGMYNSPIEERRMREQGKWNLLGRTASGQNYFSMR